MHPEVSGRVNLRKVSCEWCFKNIDFIRQGERRAVVTLPSPKSGWIDEYDERMFVIYFVKSRDVKWSRPGHKMGEFAFFRSKNLFGIRDTVNVTLVK